METISQATAVKKPLKNFIIKTNRAYILVKILGVCEKFQSKIQFQINPNGLFFALSNSGEEERILFVYHIPPDNLSQEPSLFKCGKKNNVFDVDLKELNTKTKGVKRNGEILHMYTNAQTEAKSENILVLEFLPGAADKDAAIKRFEIKVNNAISQPIDMNPYEKDYNLESFVKIKCSDFSTMSKWKVKDVRHIKIEVGRDWYQFYIEDGKNVNSLSTKPNENKKPIYSGQYNLSDIVTLSKLCNVRSDANDSIELHAPIKDSEDTFLLMVFPCSGLGKLKVFLSKS